MLLVAAEGNRPVRRRYTIRQLDLAQRLLTLDVVLHGDGPGERWVRAARPGDRIEGIGPRGKITTAPAADWHLFIGDESALPAIFAMTESLPGDSVATVVIEVPDPADEQELLAAGPDRLTWLHRPGRPGGRAGRAGRRGGGGRAAARQRRRPTCWARPRSCWPCARCWPAAACRGPDVPQGLLGPRPGQCRPRRARPRRLAGPAHRTAWTGRPGQDQGCKTPGWRIPAARARRPAPPGSGSSLAHATYPSGRTSTAAGSTRRDRAAYGTTVNPPGPRSPAGPRYPPRAGALRPPGRRGRAGRTSRRGRTRPAAPAARRPGSPPRGQPLARPAGGRGPRRAAGG